jgi:hypothetical protein
VLGVFTWKMDKWQARPSRMCGHCCSDCIANRSPLFFTDLQPNSCTERIADGDPNSSADCNSNFSANIKPYNRLPNRLADIKSNRSSY